MTAPIALERLEDAIATWLIRSTGATVYHVEPELAGAPVPAPPAVQIRMLTTVMPIGQPEVRKIPSIVQHRWTVTSVGPGQVGVLFYLGSSLDPVKISIAAGPGQSTEDSAAALLAEVILALPAGTSAQLDPDDASSVLVDGSSAEPMFAASPVDGAMLSVVVLRQRFPELELEWSRMTWRVRFRSTATRGFGSAYDLAIRARKAMNRVLDPLTRAAGWRLSGVLAVVNDTPDDRGEGIAILDFALEGYATAVYQSPAARAIGAQAQLNT